MLPQNGRVRLLFIHNNLESPCLLWRPEGPSRWLKTGRSGPEARLVLGKAESTLLTGASLSRETEAADGLGLGCLAPADEIP